MKKFTIILVIATFNFDLLTLNCIAQPNGDFEDWGITANYERPDSWQTLNILSLFSPPNPLSAFKATGVDKHSGNYALKIKTIYINNNPAPQQIPDTLGYVFTGKVILSPPSIRFGIAYTGRPQTLEFWAKYFPVGDDLGGAVIILRKWNGISSDTIAEGNIKITDTVAAYTLFQSDLTYRSVESPDTLIIVLASSYKQSKARVGSVIYIDDVALTGWVGINEPQNCISEKIKIFPNPAKEEVTILSLTEEADNIRLIDVSGKTVFFNTIQNQRISINTTGFAEGIYLCEIRNKKNKILTTGKFNIVK